MNDFDLTSALKIMNTVKAYFIFPINAKSGTSVYLLYGTRVRIKSYLSAQLLAVWFEKACIGFVKKGFITYHDSAGQFVWSMTVESSQWTNQEFVQEIGSSIYRAWKCNKLNLRMVQEIKAKSGIQPQTQLVIIIIHALPGFTYCLFNKAYYRPDRAQVHANFNCCEIQILQGNILIFNKNVSHKFQFCE